MAILNAGALGALLVIRNNQQRMRRMREEANRSSRNNDSNRAYGSSYQSRQADNQLREKQFEAEQRTVATIERVNELADSLKKKQPDPSRQELISQMSELVSNLKPSKRTDFEELSQKLEQAFDELKELELDPKVRLSMQESLGRSIHQLQRGNYDQKERTWTGWNDLLKSSRNPDVLRMSAQSLGMMCEEARHESNALGAFFKAFENNQASPEAVRALVRGFDYSKLPNEAIAECKEQFLAFAKRSIQFGEFTVKVQTNVRELGLTKDVVPAAIVGLHGVADRLEEKMRTSRDAYLSVSSQANIPLGYIEMAIDSPQAAEGLPALRRLQEKFSKLLNPDGALDRYQRRNLKEMHTRISSLVDYIDLSHNGFDAIDDWSRTLIPDLKKGLSTYHTEDKNHQIKKDPFSSHTQAVLEYIETNTDSEKARAVSDELSSIRDDLANKLIVASEDSRFNTVEFEALHARIASICDALSGTERDEGYSPLQRYLSEATTESLLHQFSYRSSREEPTHIDVMFNQELAGRFDTLIDEVHPNSFRELRKQEIEAVLEAQRTGYYDDLPLGARIAARGKSALLAITPNALLKRSFRNTFNPEHADLKEVFTAMDTLRRISSWQS